MMFRNSRVRRGRAFQLEGLEDRALLSAASVAEIGAVHAERAKPKPKLVVVKGVIQGQLTELTTTSPNTQVTGQGSANLLPGTVLVNGTQTSTQTRAALKVSGGNVTFTPEGASTGSLLQVVYSGSGKISRGVNQKLTLTGKVVGGAGAYAGATGTFTASVNLNAVTHAFTFNYTMQLRGLA